MTSITDLIGNTPVMELTKLQSNRNIRILAKLEGQNIGGSIKDRIALSMIRAAEADGTLTKEKTILEATSGNTGIALAMIAAAEGYAITLTMAENASEERKKMLRAFGAELILTPASDGTGGAIAHARMLATNYPDRYWFSNQHENPANPHAHQTQTAQEILRQIPDITHFIAGLGTCGTLLGVSRALRAARSDIRIVGIEPLDRIDGLRNMQEANPPALFQDIKLDAHIMVERSNAIRTAQLLARTEGLLVGISSGANCFGALEYAQSITEGTLVVMFPDRGEKYLSGNLFGPVRVED